MDTLCEAYGEGSDAGKDEKKEKRMTRSKMEIINCSSDVCTVGRSEGPIGNRYSYIKSVYVVTKNQPQPEGT